MKIAYFFPYIFYTFSKVYKRGIDNKDPDIYACSFLTLMQVFNLTIALRYILSKDNQLYMGVFCGVILFIGNYFLFFNDKTLKKYEERWSNQSKAKKSFGAFGVLLYVIGTFVCFFIL